MVKVIVAAVLSCARLMACPESVEIETAPAIMVQPETVETVEAVEIAEAEIELEALNDVLPVPACELEESNQTYAGTYRITYYCPCADCNGGWSGTASGEPLTPGYTVACPDFSFGTTILIDGVGYRCVQDLGVGSGQIDICVGSHEEALALGMHYSDVWICGM